MKLEDLIENYVLVDDLTKEEQLQMFEEVKKEQNKIEEYKIILSNKLLQTEIILREKLKELSNNIFVKNKDESYINDFKDNEYKRYLNQKIGIFNELIEKQNI